MPPTEAGSSYDEQPASGLAAPLAAKLPTPLSWLVWGLGAVFFGYGFFQRVAPSVMIDQLMRDLAVGGAILGNLSAFYFYAYASLQIPIGLMLDRWGPRRMLSLGALLCACGSVIFALAEGLTLAYAGRLLIGAGAAFAFVGSLKLATHWFPPQRFAQVSGLTMMLGMAGGVLGQAPLAALVEAAGWRGLLWGAGMVGLLLAAALWLIVRDRPPHEPPALRAVVTRRENLLVALTGASMSAPLLAFAGLWGVAWLMQTYGLTRPAAAGIASLLLIGWAVGAPAAGALSDRIGRRRPLLALGALIGLSCLALLIYLPALPALLMSGLFLIAGLALGAMVVSFAVAREVNPPEQTGAAYGFVNGAVVATGAIFQPLIGWLLDLQWDGAMAAGARVYDPEAYRFAFSVLLVFLVVGLLATLGLPAMRARREGRETT